MALDSYTRAMLLHEARSLVARLAMVKPFALQEPMLPAAALLPAAHRFLHGVNSTPARTYQRGAAAGAVRRY